MESMCTSLQKKKQSIKGDLKDQLNDLYRRIDVLSAEKTSLLVRMIIGKGDKEKVAKNSREV